MPTTGIQHVRMVRAAVKLWNDRLAPGLFGLACSGGADSMALADAAIAELGAANVVVIHIDHGLSPGSAEVAEAVAAWAVGQGVVAVVRRVEVVRRASLEAAARDARYAALDAIADEIGASWILLAHTARDQAETVLMRIVRGTGPAGLAGIPTIRGRFLRPLLELPRETVDAYVAARNLPTWLDPMNTDVSLSRVRFRERIMPALRLENPALDEALCRLAASAREWMGAIDERAEPFSRFPIDIGAIVEVDNEAVRKRAYARALETANLGYDAIHLDGIDRIVSRPSDGELAIDVPGGRVVRTYDTLDIEPTAGGAGVPAPRGASELAALGLEVRHWRAGDRMKPARLKGRSRKLSDLFIDAKLPRALRAAARVVIRTDDQAILWCEYVGVAFGVPPEQAGVFEDILLCKRT